MVGRASAGEARREAPFAHDENGVGEANQLGEFGRGDDDRAALAREAAQQRMDLRFGVDVDALGRLLGENDSGSALKQPREARPFADCRR
jgi:hypothetical protein